MKIPSSEQGENMLCTEIVFVIQNNFCTQHVLPMFCKNKNFYKDLPVIMYGKTVFKYIFFCYPSFLESSIVTGVC